MGENRFWVGWFSAVSNDANEMAIWNVDDQCAHNTKSNITSWFCLLNSNYTYVYTIPISITVSSKLQIDCKIVPQKFELPN